jgi:hypothetical protein
MLEDTSEDLREKIHPRSTLGLMFSVENTHYTCPEGLSAIETSILLADIEATLSAAQAGKSNLFKITLDFGGSQPLPEPQFTQFIDTLSEADNVLFYAPTEDTTQEIRNGRSTICFSSYEIQATRLSHPRHVNFYLKQMIEKVSTSSLESNPASNYQNGQVLFNPNPAASETETKSNSKMCTIQ